MVRITTEMRYLDQIDALTAENVCLRAALKAYVDHADEDSERLPCCQAVLDQARTALGTDQQNGDKQ